MEYFNAACLQQVAAAGEVAIAEDLVGCFQRLLRIGAASQRAQISTHPLCDTRIQCYLDFK